MLEFFFRKKNYSDPSEERPLFPTPFIYRDIIQEDGFTIFGKHEDFSVKKRGLERNMYTSVEIKRLKHEICLEGRYGSTRETKIQIDDRSRRIWQNSSNVLANLDPNLSSQSRPNSKPITGMEPTRRRAYILCTCFHQKDFWERIFLGKTGEKVLQYTRGYCRSAILQQLQQQGDVDASIAG